MKKATPLLGLEHKDCLLCCRSFEKSKFVKFTDQGWGTIQNAALKWKDINVDINDPTFLYTTVHERVRDRNAFGAAHKSCRIIFCTKIAIYATRFGSTDEEEKPLAAVDDEKPSCSSSSSSILTRKSLAKITEEVTCFVCNTVQDSDGNPYNEGGVGQPKEKDVVANLKERTQQYLADSSHEYHTAACRFVRDIGGLDGEGSKVHYHQQCYIRY